MTKSEFLEELRGRLNALSQVDVERSLDFYGEMIDDRMEDGMTEAEAVANMGDLNRIAEQITNQESHSEENTKLPFDTPSDAGSSRKRYVLRNPWVVGFLSPFILILWAIVVAIVISFWAIVAALYAVDLALGASGGALHVAGTALFCTGRAGEGLLVFGAGAFLIGLTVLWSLGCKYFTLAMAKITKWTFKGLTAMIVKKEGAV